MQPVLAYGSQRDDTVHMLRAVLKYATQPVALQVIDLINNSQMGLIQNLQVCYYIQPRQG